MEGTGYKIRKTLKGHAIVMFSFFAWSRGIDPSQQNIKAVVFQRKREVYHGHFRLKKYDVISICRKIIPVQ